MALNSSDNPQILENWGEISDYAKRHWRTIRNHISKGLNIIYNDAGHPVTTKEEIDRFYRPVYKMKRL